MSTFLAITSENYTFDRTQNSKWFAVKCIATIGSPNEGELLNMERLINGERNWTQGDENYNTLFSSKLVCLRKEGQGVEFHIYPSYWTYTRTRIRDTNVYDYYFTLYFDWSEYSYAYVEAQANNYINTSHVGFYVQNSTTYYDALHLYLYGGAQNIISLLTYDSNKWGLSINANMPLEFNVEPNNIITAYYDIVVKYQDHNYLYVAFNTSNNWLFNLGGIFGVHGQPTDKLLDCTVTGSTITEDGDARTTTIKVKLTGDRDTIVDILELPYPQGLVLLANHLMLNAASTPLTNYVINDSTPIISLPTTTQYNRGDITLPTNIAIVDSNTTEQNKVEYNTASIVYTLTDATDESVIYTGVGTWSSKTSITDPEQGAMQDNTINVLFSNIPIGEYTYKVVYTYSDGNVYTAEMTINVIALTLGYFGVSYTQMGYVLNRPISLQFSVTTDSTPGGIKPAFLQVKCTCVDTQLSMTRYIYVESYRAIPFVDFRPILPNYYNANKKTYTITIESILLNNTWQEYDTAVDTINIIVNDASDKVAWSMWLYNGECNQMTTCILPQFLSPIQGYNTRLWLTFFANNQRLYKNTTLIYTSLSNSWSNGYWHTEIFDFTDINVEDVLIVRGLWSLNDTLKPIIASEAERVMVKFIAPDDVEMPEFAMLLDGIYSEPKIVDSYITAQKTYPTITSMYDVVEKMTLYIPMLTNRSIYYYHELFANQNTIKLSNGGEWCEYILTDITVQNATEGYDNGVFTIELQKTLTTKKYMQL